MNPLPKFICNRIADKTCTHTTNCCAHRIPHVLEEGMTCTGKEHECRFAPEKKALCVPYPPVEPVEEPGISELEKSIVATISAGNSIPAMPVQKMVEYIPPSEPVNPVEEPLADDAIVVEGDGKLLSVQNMEAKPIKKPRGGKKGGKQA